MPRMSADLAAQLIRPSVPDETVEQGVTPQRAAFIAQATFTRTGIDITVPQVYEGIGWLRENANRGEAPWLTIPGIGGGYFRSLNAQMIERGLQPRLRYLNTHLRRSRSGIILPYADLVIAPVDQARAIDLVTRYDDAVAAVAAL